MVKPPDRALLGYLESYDPHVTRLVLALREVVLEEAPEAVESISKGYAVAIGFSFTGKPLKDGFCHIVACSSHVNLGFNRGALLPDPNGVLAGTGKLIRHLTIRSEADLERPLVRKYLQAAIEQAPRPPRGTPGRAPTAGPRMALEAALTAHPRSAERRSQPPELAAESGGIRHPSHRRPLYESSGGRGERVMCRTVPSGPPR